MSLNMFLENWYSLLGGKNPGKNRDLAGGGSLPLAKKFVNWVRSETDEAGIGRSGGGDHVTPR